MPLSQEELREALMLHSELEDIHQRLEIMQAMSVNFDSVKNMLTRTKNAVKDTASAVVHAFKAGNQAYKDHRAGGQKEQPAPAPAHQQPAHSTPTPQEVSNHLHYTYNVHVAVDRQGNVDFDLHGARVDVKRTEDKSAWEVCVGEACKQVSSFQEMDQFINEHAKPQPAPHAQAQFKEVLRCSNAILRSTRKV